MQELASSCIYCSAGDEFGATLIAMLNAVRTAAIVAETCGDANPPALLTVLQDERLPLETVVTILDAATFAHSRRYAREVEWQVAFADRAMLNKVDLTAVSALASAETLGRGINPHAATIRSVWGAIGAALLVVTPTRRAAHPGSPLRTTRHRPRITTSATI